MSNVFYKPLIFFGGLLYPLYALPWIVKSMLKNEVFGYFLFSLTMAYFAYLMVPYNTFDLVRHYEAFEKLKVLDFGDILLGTGNAYLRYPFYIYVWIVAHIGLPKEFLPFSVIFIIYFLSFLILQKIYRREAYSLSKKIIIILGIVFVVNEIRFVGHASGLRNGLAFVIFLYALFDYFLDKKVLVPILLSLLASAIHISVLPLVIVFIAARFLKFHTLGKIAVIIGLILIMLGLNGVVFYKIIGLLEPYLRAWGLYFHAYMDPTGAWGSGYYLDKNIKTIILEKIIKPMPFFLSAFYLIKVRSFTLNRAENYLYFLFIFVLLVSVSRTMLDRYSYFFVLLFMYTLLTELQTKPLSVFKKLFVSVLVISMLLMDVGGAIKYRDIFVKSWTKTLYIPAPIMMMETVSPNRYIKREGL